MDDVIERMGQAFWAAMNRRESPESAMRAALRAVHDTHRLVPVKADEAHCMRAMLEWGEEGGKDAARIYRHFVDASPDYTEAK